MVNLIVSAVLIWKAVIRKCYSLIPAAMLIGAYMVARIFEIDFIGYAGRLERLLLIGVVCSTAFACRKGRVHGVAVFFAAAALILRYLWRGVAQQIFDAMYVPGMDTVALLAQSEMLRKGFEGAVFVLLLAVQLLMLCRLRKV